MTLLVDQASTDAARHQGSEGGGVRVQPPRPPRGEPGNRRLRARV